MSIINNLALIYQSGEVSQTIMGLKDLKDNTYLWFGISTLVILVMAYFADIYRMIDVLSSTDLRVIPITLLFGLMPLVIWSTIWFNFFNISDIEVGRLESLQMFVAGAFTNSITPLGQVGGEPLMAYIISDSTGSDYESALATVLSTDIMTFTPIITFITGGIAYLMFFGAVTEMLKEALYATIVMALIGGPLVYIMWFEAGKIESFLLELLERVSKLVGRGEQVVKKAEKSLNTMEDSFAKIGGSPAVILKAGVLAHLGLLSHVVCLYFALAAVGFDVRMIYLCIVLPLSGIANFSPTPGGSGAYEFTMTALLVALAPIGFAAALSVAILFRLMTYWPTLLIGYLTFNKLLNKESADRR